VPEDVAALHRGLIAVEQMEVGAANRTGCDFYDRVSGVLDGGDGHRVYPNIAFSMATKCAHWFTFSTNDGSVVQPAEGWDVPGGLLFV